MTDRYVGVHFPKAGGNSLLVALRERFGEKLALDYADAPALPEGARHLDPDGHFAKPPPALSEGWCAFGHFHPAKYDGLDAVRFVTLRHPVATMFSIYFYWRSVPLGGSLHQYFMREQLDVIGLARLPLLRWLMTRSYFENYNMRDFDFIGRHEAREATNARLASLLSLQPFDESHVNKTADDPLRQELENDPRTLFALTDLLRDDIAFYETHAFRDV